MKYFLCSIYKVFTKNFPNYFGETYVPLEVKGVHTRSSYQKLNDLIEKKMLDKKPYLMLVPQKKLRSFYKSKCF